MQEQNARDLDAIDEESPRPPRRAGEAGQTSGHTLSVWHELSSGTDSIPVGFCRPLPEFPSDERARPRHRVRRQ